MSMSMSTSTAEQKFTAHRTVDEGLPILRLRNEGGTMRWVYPESHPKASILTVAEAMALLSPVDCAYMLVFARGKGEDAEKMFLEVTPAGAESMSGFLLKEEVLPYFAHYDTVEITGLRAVVREPQGPHCKVVGGNLQLRVGTQTITWPTVTIKNLSWLGTAHLAAICNPHKCNVRIKAVGPNEHKVTYFTAGKAMTPGDLLEYEYLELISAEPSEEN